MGEIFKSSCAKEMLVIIIKKEDNGILESLSTVFLLLDIITCMFQNQWLIKCV